MFQMHLCRVKLFISINSKAADMETMHVIFENYGGQQIGRIFKNYFSLTFLLKQILFSLSIISADRPVVNFLPEEKRLQIENIAEEAPLDRELNWIQILQINLLKAGLDADKTNGAEEDLNQ